MAATHPPIRHPCGESCWGRESCSQAEGRKVPVGLGQRSFVEVQEENFSRRGMERSRTYRALALQAQALPLKHWEDEAEAISIARSIYERLKGEGLV